MSDKASGDDCDSVSYPLSTPESNHCEGREERGAEGEEKGKGKGKGAGEKKWKSSRKSKLSQLQSQILA